MNDLFTPKELEWIENNQELIESKNFKAIYEELVYGKSSDYNRNALNLKLTIAIHYLDQNWKVFILNKPDPGKSFGWYSLDCKLDELREGDSYRIVNDYSDRELTDLDIQGFLLRALSQSRLGQFPKMIQIVKEILKHKINE